MKRCLIRFLYPVNTEFLTVEYRVLSIIFDRVLNRCWWFWYISFLFARFCKWRLNGIKVSGMVMQKVLCRFLLGVSFQYKLNVNGISISWMTLTMCSIHENSRDLWLKLMLDHLLRFFFCWYVMLFITRKAEHAEF